MGSSLKDVEQMARALAAEERAQLAESLLASLQVPPLSDIEILWNRETQARVAELKRQVLAIHN